MPVQPYAKVHLRDRVEPQDVQCVHQQRQLDAVPARERQPLEQAAACRVLPGERLDHPRELRPVEVEQRACDELGDPPAAGPRDKVALHEGTVVHGLHQRDARIGEGRAEQPGDVRRCERPQVGVDEHEHVAGRRGERAPHGLTLAGRQSAGGGAPRHRARRWRRQPRRRPPWHRWSRSPAPQARRRAGGPRRSTRSDAGMDRLDDRADRRRLVAGGQHHAHPGRALGAHQQLQRPVRGPRRAGAEPGVGVRSHAGLLAAGGRMAREAGRSTMRTRSDRSATLTRVSPIGPGSAHVAPADALPPLSGAGTHNRTSHHEGQRDTARRSPGNQRWRPRAQRAWSPGVGANSVRSAPRGAGKMRRKAAVRDCLVPHPGDRRVRLRTGDRARLPRVRCQLRPRCGVRLPGLLRTARGLVRLHRRSRASGSSRARPRSGATPACCPSRRTPADEPNLNPGLTRLVRADNLAEALGMRARCGSRTTAATRRTRSRTGWSPSRRAAARRAGTDDPRVRLDRQPGRCRRCRGGARRDAARWWSSPATWRPARPSPPRSTAAR